MEARATLKYARISPRKVKIVLDLIRNQDADKAMAILKFTPKSACEYLEKLLASAMANAENNHNMDVSRLYVAECFVCPGPTLKRIRPKDHGRAHRILNTADDPAAQAAVWPSGGGAAFGPQPHRTPAAMADDPGRRCRHRGGHPQRDLLTAGKHRTDHRGRGTGTYLPFRVGAPLLRP